MRLDRLTVRLLTIAVTSVAMFGLVLAGGIRQAWLAATLECATLLDEVALEGIAAADAEVAERNGIWALAVPTEAGGCFEMRLGDGSLPVSRDDVRMLATAALARRSTLREYVASLAPE